MTANQVIELIRSAQTPDEIRAANQAQTQFMKISPAGEDIAAVQAAQSESIAAMLDRHEMERQPALRYLALNGTDYNLEDWLTLAEYARRYELKTPNVVTNWINRGIIPPTDVIEVFELNDLKLVRNKVYKEPKNTSSEVDS